VVLIPKPGQPCATDNKRQVSDPLGRFPAADTSAQIKPMPPPSGYIVLPEVVVPEFVVVHDGVPADSSAPNYWYAIRITSRMSRPVKSTPPGRSRP
jgi:hypothetical protein